MEQKRQIKNFILFVVKLALVFGLAYLAYQGLFWFLWEYDNGPRAYKDSYQHALYLQYEQISNPDRENEIIFFGSSTCAFGIDTAAVKEVTGMNAQIFGIESAVSPVFLCNQLKDIAKPGDIICCIYDGGDDSGADFITVSCAFEDNKDWLKNYWLDHAYAYDLHKNSLCWRKLYALSVGGVVEDVRSRFSKKDQVYKLSSFDENGNMTLDRPECFVSSDVEPGLEYRIDDIDPDLTAFYNEFNSWCVENDIRFVVAYNMHPEGSYINDAESFKAFDDALENALDAEVITAPEDGLLPYDCFYNSYFHLNSKGAKEYSERIARKLL